MASIRLPVVGSDLNSWGTDLNAYLNDALASYLVDDQQWGGGAAGDGTTDDSAAIQGALTAARIAGGGIVRLTAGKTYAIAQSLQVGSNTVLYGPGATIKAQNGFAATQVGSNGGMVMLATYNDGAVAQSNITVYGVTLDMNEANATLPAYASQLRSSPMSFKNVTNLTAGKVQVVNAVGYSFFPQNCTSVLVSGCVISSGQTAVGTNASQDCLHILDCTGVTLSGNILQSGTHGGDDPIAIQGVVTGTTDVAITGNVILASGTHGIALYIGGASVTNVAITGNEVKNTQKECFLIAFNTYAAGALISDVTLSGNVFQNIGLSGGRAVTLEDGTDATPQHIGVAGWRNVAITGNVFSGFTSASAFGFYAQTGTNLQVMANTFDAWDCQRGFQIGDNISATSCTVNGFQVVGNTVNMASSTATSPAGIVVVDSPDGVVGANTVTGPGTGVAGGRGIWVLGIGTAPTGTAVNGNRVKAWASAIIEDNGGAQPNYNVFVGNNCHGNTAFITTSGTNTTAASNVVA